MKEINKNIAMNIKNYLNIFGISQQDLAKRLDCSNSTVTMWIKGNATPRLEKIDQMCDLFGCERGDLLADTPKTAEEAKLARRLRLFMKKFLQMGIEDQLDLLTYMEEHYEQ